jgi:hypothetical protein
MGNCASWETVLEFEPSKRGENPSMWQYHWKRLMRSDWLIGQCAFDVSTLGYNFFHMILVRRLHTV